MNRSRVLNTTDGEEHHFIRMMLLYIKIVKVLTLYFIRYELLATSLELINVNIFLPFIRKCSRATFWPDCDKYIELAVGTTQVYCTASKICNTYLLQRCVSYYLVLSSRTFDILCLRKN